MVMLVKKHGVICLVCVLLSKKIKTQWVSEQTEPSLSNGEFTCRLGQTRQTCRPPAPTECPACRTPGCSLASSRWPGRRLGWCGRGAVTYNRDTVRIWYSSFEVQRSVSWLKTVLVGMWMDQLGHAQHAPYAYKLKQVFAACCSSSKALVQFWRSLLIY